VVTPTGQTPIVTPTASPPGQTPGPTTPGQTPGPTQTAGPTPSAQLQQGDINCDGFINELDVVDYLTVIAALHGALFPGCAFPLGEEVFVNVALGDYNCDGLINELDVILLLFYLDGAGQVAPDCLGIGQALPLGNS
jgi:hypothetical protein